MTENKPIIIDGIDVSGCDYLYTYKYNDKCCRASIGGDALCKPSEMMCFKYSEALRKQLTRKTQEGEKWKNAYEVKKDALEEAEEYTEELEEKYHKLQEQLDRLKTENDGLKDDIEGLKRNLLDKENSSARYYLITSHREWNEMYKKINYQRNKKEQAEQKLERIREIAKQMNNECFYDDFDCKDCDMKNGCTYFNKGKILQIIDEVE